MRPARAALAGLLRRAPAVSARVEKRLWRSVYDAANRGRTDPGTALMNYGYAPLDGAPDGMGVPPGPDRFGLQMYAACVGGTGLAGRDVLDVGCGRGGGTAFVHERFGPRSATGVDLSRKGVARCRAVHARPGLRFVSGDAERLPFAAGSFDAVLSVESSHCYPDMGRFLDEVARVLRPGGALLLTDFRHTVLSEELEDALLPQEDVAALRRQLQASPLRVVAEEDITANVVRALELDSPSRRARIEQRVPKPLQRQALEFQGVEGSVFHRSFAERRLTYLRIEAQKPEA